MDVIELSEKFVKALRKRKLSTVPTPVGVLFPMSRRGLNVQAYHLTFFKNLSSIRTFGLVPRLGSVRRFGLGAPGVYLASRREGLIDMLHEQEYPKEVRDGKEPVILLEVMVPLGAPAMMDPEASPDTFIVLTPVPPFLITPVEVWLKEKSSSWYFPYQGLWREEMESGWKSEMKKYLTRLAETPPMPSIAEQVAQWEKRDRLLKGDDK